MSAPSASTPSSEADVVAFALVHICIRNDDHCPVCKRIYVSFHSSWEAAKDFALGQIHDEDKLEEARSDLDSASSCWVDEWVRRRNGDRYLVCPVASGTCWDISNPREIGVGKNLIQDKVQANFVALHILVDHSQFCPDNLKYHVALFQTADEAARHLADAYEQETDPYTGDEDKDTHKLTDVQVQAVAALNPVWIDRKETDSTHASHHLQVIPIKVWKNDGGGHALRMELNKYCPQIQPEEWFKTKSQYD